MKLAIIGDSHTACMILANKNRASELGNACEKTFFSAVGRSMEALEVSGTICTPTTGTLKRQMEASSGGLTEIALPDYDAFLLIGMGFRVPLIEDYYSSAVTERTVLGHMQDAAIWRIAQGIRAVTDRPILCGHKPMRADPPEADDRSLISYDALLDIYTREGAAFGVTVLPQPAQTRDQGLYTKEAFSKNSKRLNTGEIHPDEDRSHMNEDYGLAYLSSVDIVLKDSAPK